jgi:hypothetical protein
MSVRVANISAKTGTWHIPNASQTRYVRTKVLDWFGVTQYVTPVSWSVPDSPCNVEELKAEVTADAEEIN